jgi:hypothetical protein
MTTGLLHVLLCAVQGDTEDHNDAQITIPPFSLPMASWTQTQHQAQVTFTSGNVQSETLGLTREGRVSSVTYILQSLRLYVIHSHFLES